MAETRFPYLLTTTREQQTNRYTTYVSTLLSQKQLAELSGKVISKKHLAAEIYLLSMESNPDDSGVKDDHYFVVLWGNNVLIFSKHMLYYVSSETKRISIVDQGRPTFIEY